MEKINKKTLIISIAVLLCLVVTAVVMVVLVACNDIEPEIFAEDKTVEFDGSAHKIEATASVAGSLTYVYTGIDNSYKSALEPAQAGEYDVTVQFKSFKDSSVIITKNVKLTITLPYTIDETGTVISNYVGHQKDVVLPATYQDKDLVTLADNTFSGKDITSVRMPETLFIANPKAFEQSGATKLIIHENSKLGDGNYQGLSIEFYERTQTIFDDAFGDVTGIAELNLPSSIKTLEVNALSKIKIEKLTLYSNLSLKDKNLSATLKSVHVFSDASQTLASGFFENCEFIENIVISEGIKWFKDRVFYNCKALKELTIYLSPEFDSYVGQDCFDEDFVLEKLTFSAGFPLHKLGLKSIEQAELMDCETLKGQAFENCTALKRITLPDTLTEISHNAFSGCTNLVQVKLPKNLKLIDYYAFSNCSALESIEIPDTTSVILDGAFRFCHQLKSVNIPASLKGISPFSFTACTSLEMVSLPEGITSIGDFAFSSCTILSEIQLPSTLEKVGYGAFSSCYFLKEIVLPENVASIGANVFMSCRQLSRVTITSSTMPYFEDEQNTFSGYELRNLTVCVPLALLDAYKQKFPDVTFEAIQNEITTKKYQAKAWYFLMVAGAGFEPHDLRVMSPMSYQAALPRDVNASFDACL